MADEAQARFGDAGDFRDGGGGGTGEPAPLQARAAFLANWHWESAVRLNERLCSGGRAQHGKNSETHERCETEWKESHAAERTLIETLDWLRSFHRKAPFLFFNGNSYAEIARTLTDALFAEFPRARRREAASLAGITSRACSIVSRSPTVLWRLRNWRTSMPAIGRTLQGSLRETVKRILPDGCIAWKPDRSNSELLALPESLLRVK